ncbi:dimethylallyltransferase [Catellatospora sp. IY07-71]|uniref:family 2 encapsulin nanocompartment cargo protein polyprenyl transferase n=1 Tax=Catellatospora sp. IY07-71 TaxID=2728827 RepID=UPI001BB32114|nr:family 2 encapsulin nanocompartment cargo protein polyprenyl transferase [Catellatospora sp. IY07-71]BCJ74270.1 dimethylallyltransferase [Catellatospora sp. IY07-71]
MSTVEMARGQSARDVLAWSRTLVDPAMCAAIGTLRPAMRRIAGYHFGWWDADGTPATRDGGKAIRPALVLVSAEAVGGEAAAAVPGAVAVELVHNFSLLHDDIMDGDVTRRHRPTAWTVFGQAPAILAGDALLSLGFDVLAACGHPAVPEAGRRLNEAVQELIDGQSADLEFEERDDVRLTECLSMAEAKTAALLGGACGLGALLGGGNAAQIAALTEFGRRTGLAFQFVDDLLGIWGDPAITGKPVHSDLAGRKKSLPVIAALTSGTPAGIELAALYRRQGPLSPAELAHAADLVDAAGARAWARARADALLTQALRRLHAADLSLVPAAQLHALARLATHRHH